MSRNRIASNEAEICEAVASLFESEIGLERHGTTHPERDGSGPPVELRFMFGAQRFAIEHTLIEPFEGAIAAGLGFVDLIATLEEKLNDAIPGPGTYTLMFPVDPASGRHRSTHASLRERIEAWVLQAAAELCAEYPERRNRDTDPHGHLGSRRTVIDGLALELRRRVHWSEKGTHDGALFLCRVVGDDLERQRHQRIIRALDDKLPKLAACKRQGDTTLLVLEYADIALTSHVSIAEVLEALWCQRDDWPDHVLIVDTTLGDTWQVFRPVIDGRFSFAMDFIELRRGPASSIMTST